MSDLTSEFPKLPEGLQWRVRYKPSWTAHSLDQVKVSIKRGWFTVASATQHVGRYGYTFREAAISGASLAWAKWQTPLVKKPDLAEMARGIEAELNRGELSE